MTQFGAKMNYIWISQVSIPSGLGLEFQKNQGLARKFSRDSEHSERGQRVYYVKIEGLFIINAKAKGVTLDLGRWILLRGSRLDGALSEPVCY
jgi:hypothetical protein